jgi:hypothetical protein
MKKSSPLRAIRKKCVDDCCCGSKSEVKNCGITDCALYEYRFGHNPKKKDKKAI